MGKCWKLIFSRSNIAEERKSSENIVRIFNSFIPCGIILCHRIAEVCYIQYEYKIPNITIKLVSHTLIFKNNFLSWEKENFVSIFLILSRKLPIFFLLRISHTFSNSNFLPWDIQKTLQNFLPSNSASIESFYRSSEILAGL